MQPGFVQHEKKLSRIYFIGLSLLVLDVVTGQEPVDCSEERLNHCSNVLMQNHELETSGPVITQDQIHKTCGPLLEADRCVVSMYENCPQIHSVPRQSTTSETMQQIQKCRILVDKYVHKLGCYQNLNNTYRMCSEKERGGFQKAVDHIRDGNKELQQEGCCTINRIFDCILKPTEEQCDKEAKSVMAEYLHSTLPVGVMSTCPQYKCDYPSSAENDQDLGRDRNKPEDDHQDHHINSINTATDRPFSNLKVLVLTVFVTKALLS